VFVGEVMAGVGRRTATTLVLLSANFSAVRRPMQDVAPVTKTTLPANSISVVILSSLMASSAFLSCQTAIAYIDTRRGRLTMIQVADRICKGESSRGDVVLIREFR